MTQYCINKTIKFEYFLICMQFFKIFTHPQYHNNSLHLIFLVVATEISMKTCIYELGINRRF